MPLSDVQTASVTCPDCGKTNTLEQKFCLGCGGGLRQACPGCKADMPVDASFCGSCGANVAKVVAAETHRVNEILDRARSLGDQHEYLDAIAHLRTLHLGRKQRTPALREAGDLIERYTTEYDRLVRLAKTALSDAEAHFARHEYTEAIRALKPVPKAFRTAQAIGLYREAHSRQQEIESLNSEIRVLAERKQLPQLASKVHRLLTLKPQSQSALKLAQKVAIELVKLARKHLARGEPEEARRLLAELPEVVRDADVRRLAETTQEQCWLLDDLQRAAVIDGALLVVADRLRKEMPEHPQVVKLTDDLKHRMRKKPDDGRLVAVDWIEPPQQTTIGPPVDWWGGMRRIQVTEPTVRQVLAQHPGRFQVACGLGLQALGLGPIEGDLLPKSAGWQGLLSNFMGRGRAGKVAWGLDLSASGLKAVKLVADDSGVTLAACELLQHDELFTDAAADAGQMSQGRTLEKFVATINPGRDERIGVNIPGHLVFGKLFPLPALASAKGKQAEQLIAYEVQQQVPFDLSELVWRSETFNAEDGTGTTRVFVMALNERQAQARADLFRNAGLRVDVLQADGAALHTLAHYEFLEKAADDSSATNGSSRSPGDSIVLLDVGTDNTNFVVSNPSSYWFRSFGLGGAHINRALVRDLNLTHHQAEMVKCNPAKARYLHKMFGACSSTLVQLGNEVRRSCDLFSTICPELKLTHVYGLGGCFQLHGVLRYLRTGE